MKKEEIFYYTPKDIELKLLLADKMLSLLDEMSLEDLKEKYRYMTREPLFTVKYIPYQENVLEGFTEKDKTDFINYFKTGLQMYKTKLENYEFLKSFDFNI